MSSRLNPYLQFDGTAREAMEFYQQVLGGDLTVNTFGEYGMPDSAEANNVMHAMLETQAGFTLMASDTGPGMEYNPGSNISISLSGDDDATLRGYWDGLCQGGQVAMPLEKQMWGDVFGQVTDRFGINWLVNIAGDPNAGAS